MATKILRSRDQTKTRGFTMVELIIVVTIVGFLSAVALPIFLEQRVKSRTTEATSQITAILKTAHADYRYDNSPSNAFLGAKDAINSANSGGVFSYSIDGDSAELAIETSQDGDVIFFVTSSPKSEADGGDASLISSIGTNKLFACVNLQTGEINIDRTFRASRNESKMTGITCD